MPESEGNIFGTEPLSEEAQREAQRTFTPEQRARYEKEIEAAETEDELHEIEEKWGGKRYEPTQSIMPELPYHKRLDQLF